MKIDDVNIGEVESTKFLGVVIDKKLTWKLHIAYISGKISRGVGMIIKARRCLNRKALLTLYYSFIFPYMTYCNHVWGTACPTNLKRVVLLQKKVIRIMLQTKRNAPTDPLFAQLRIMPFPNINIYLIGRFMYRFVNGMLPTMLSSLFIFNRNVHRYSTRQVDLLHVPLVKSNLGKNNIIYRGPIILNALTKLDVSMKTSEAVLSSNIKRVLCRGSLLYLR